MTNRSSKLPSTAAAGTREWDLLARRLIAGLRATPGVLFGDHRPRAGLRSQAEDLFSDASLGDLLPQPELEEALQRGEDPTRVSPDGSDRPAQLPRPGPLQAVLRLARHFVTQEALIDGLLARWQLAIVVTGEAAMVEPAELVIEKLGQLRSLSGKEPSPRVLRAVDAFIETPGDRDAGDPFRRWGPKLQAALESEPPIIIVVASLTDLPAGVGRLHPNIVLLPRLDGELVMAHLRRSHAATGRLNETLVRPHLPEDAALAALPLEALTVSLRAATPGAVAHRLAEAARPPARERRGTLADFPLAAEVRVQIERIVADLAAVREGRAPADRITRGALLVGPPGSGKTEVARLIAEAAGVPLHATTLADMQATGRHADFLREMKRVFAEAMQRAPSVLFLDELDALGDRARAPDHNSAYTDSVVCALLAQLDGAEGRPGVVVIGATNHPNKIDAALLRAGRFDRWLHIDQPGPEQIPAALRYHLRGELADAALDPVAAAAVGLTGAEVALAVRDARALARAAGRPLAVEDLSAAVARLRPPLPRHLRWRIAVHEAGHAVVAAATGHARPRLLALHRGGGTAEAQIAPGHGSRAELAAALATMMAGRAAETLILGAPSAGAGGPAGCDLHQATRLALALETNLGLGEGTLWLGDARDLTGLLGVDRALRACVQAHLDTAEAEAAQILSTHRARLLSLAEALERAGLLHGATLEAHLDGLVPPDGELAPTG